MGLTDAFKCRHKWTEHKKIDEWKSIVKCKLCGIFAKFDMKECTLTKIDLEE